MNGLLDATSNVATVTEWWTRNPSANIGIATEPSGIVVLDVDPRHNGDESLAILRGEIGRAYFDTVTAITGGGGQHLVYAARSTPVRSQVSILGEGLDTRGKGGYIVVAPSVHSSGGYYRWEEGYGPHEASLLPFPDALLAKLVVEEKKRTVDTVGEIIPHGTQHATLVSIAGTLRRRGLGESAILATLLDVNKNQCQIPGPEENIRKIAHSVAQYAPQTPITGMIIPDPTPLSVKPEQIGSAMIRSLAQPTSDMRRYRSGIEHLDRVTGGFRPGEMTLLGAWTGVGKSAFAQQVAMEVGRQSKVLFLPLELGVHATEKRILSQLSKFNEDWVDYAQREGRVKELYPYIEELQSRQIEMLAPPMDEAFGYNQIRDLILDSKPDFVIIDHLQHIDDWTPSASKRSDLNAAEIVRRFRSLADQQRIHLLLVHQLKADKLQKSQRPQIYDFADTAALPRVADTVIALHRPMRWQPNFDTVMEILVLKNRHGPEPWIHTRYTGSVMSITSMSEEEEANVICCRHK